MMSEGSGYGALDLNNGESSRQSKRYATLRLRNAAMSCPRDGLPEDEVIAALRNLKDVDEPDGEVDSRHAIRDLHYSLSVKRRILFKLSDRQRKGKRRIGFVSLIKYKTHFAGVKIRRNFSSFLTHLNLWENSIKLIEGRFGSSVASYFIFLRRMFVLNIFISIICLAFLLVPQLVHDGGKLGAETPTVDPLPSSTKKHREVEYVVDSNDGMKVWDFEIRSRQPEVFTQNRNASNTEFEWHNLLTGSGALGDSLMFYGAYSNGSATPNGYLGYDMPSAYLFTVASCLIICLIVLTVWLGRVYKEHTVTSMGSRKNLFTSLVFCSWDFTLTPGSMAELKSEALYREMLEELSSVVDRRPRLRFKEKCELFARRFCNHIVVLGLLVGSGALVWYLLKRKSLQSEVTVLDDLAIPLTVTAVLLVVPVAFSVLIQWEGYKSKYTELNVTMIRMFLLLLTVMGVVVYFWFKVSSWEAHNVIVNSTLCWETLLGEEIYSLLLIDFLVVTLPSIPFGYLRRVLHDKGFGVLGHPVFDLPTNALYLIYNQILCWLGLFYFPMVPSFVVLKLFFTFYIGTVHVRLNCSPPEKAWRAAKAQKIFLLLSFIALIASLVPVGYSIIRLRPSTSCGPFQYKDTVSESIMDLLHGWKLNKEWLGMSVHFLTRPGWIAGYLVALGVALLHSLAYNSSHSKMVAMLRDQLIMEGKDKTWLQEILNAALKKSQRVGHLVPRNPRSPPGQDSAGYYNIHVYEPMSPNEGNPYSDLHDSQTSRPRRDV